MFIYICTHMYIYEPEIVQFFYTWKEWLADATIPAREVTFAFPLLRTSLEWSDTKVYAP